MGNYHLLSALVSLLLIPALLFAGDIKGSVKLKGKKTNANAVVYIEKIPGKTFKPPEKGVDMDQKNMVFIPHVLPVVAGTKVNFLNSDDVLHNVFTPDACAEKFNLGTWPKGQVRSYTFKKSGCFAVMLCNVHPEMEAWVVVLENPYFAVSSKDGSYEIKGVPAGTYTLKTWYKDFKAKSMQVTVPESGPVEWNFELAK